MPPYESRVESDDWYTPKFIFDALGEEFDLDVASPAGGPRYVPASRWYSFDALSYPWFGFVWMNPPYAHQASKRLWLEKFTAHGNGIALLPDRTSAPWWQEYAPRMDQILFTAGKIKFERPDRSVGGSPGTGTTLMAVGARGVAALQRATSLGTCYRIVDDAPAMKAVA